MQLVRQLCCWQPIADSQVVGHGVAVGREQGAHHRLRCKDLRCRPPGETQNVLRAIT